MKTILLNSVAVAALALGLGSAAMAQDATMGEWGIETEHVSPTVAPGDDFFTYVNEGWLETAQIQPGFSSTGGFVDLHIKSQEQVAELIAEVVAHGGAMGTPEQQIADLYAAFLNQDRLDELGLAPIQADLDAVAAITTYEDVADFFGRPFHSSAISVGILLDSGNPDRYLVHMEQGGTNLPDRSFYLEQSDRYVRIRAAYVDYIEATLTRAGYDNARAQAENLLALETRIAQAQWTIEQQRDRIASYDLQTRAELEAFADGFPWGRFFESLGIADQTEFVVETNTAVQAIAAMFRDVSLDDWKTFLTFNYIDNHASMLPRAYDDAQFGFYSQAIYGTAEQRARDQRSAAFVSGQFGELIGQLYVERYFSAEQKAEMEELVGYLLRAYEERISNLDWMDDATRAEALDKLSRFGLKIGYPDQWRDYSSITVDADNLIETVHRISAWYWADQIEALHGPRRDWEWGMSPQTVNAYYSSDRNEIVFPAAILQAPYYDPNADMAVNFGAIGGVIGHEIGHGFDDRGSRSDGHGILRNWWTEESRADFDARTEVLIAQYDAFEPVEGEHVNGEITLGENIGDLGGLDIALYAYQLYLADHGGEAEVLDGFTPTQRVFLGWAQAFRVHRTEESLVAIMRSDVHSPGQYRVNGIVRNLDAWYEAFDVREGDAMYLAPEDRVTIW